MNREKAIRVLELKQDITNDNIKKNYRLLALKYHPDKNKSNNANEKFLEINEAYNYLLSNNNNNNNYSDILKDFLQNIIQNNDQTEMMITIFNNILNNCETKTIEFIKSINKYNLIIVMSIIKKYKNVLHFSDNFIEKVQDILNDKVQNDENIILNPSIDDLLEDNIYKLIIGNERILIPLWHKKLTIERENKTIYVYCKPILDNNIDIDDNNNIIINKDFYIKDIGIKCVVDEPWVTVAETCEFIISLMISGKKKKAKKLLTDVLNISDENKIPYMGWQYEENIFWPDEKPSWTAAALIICADSILKLSDASDLFVENQLSFY